MPYKSFNLDKKYPQVILVGNGITRGSGIEWTKLIEKCARPGIDISSYKKDKRFLVPNNILTLAALIVDDTKRHNSYSEQLSKIEYTNNELINKLIALPGDAILTTNYTYELEYSIDNKYPSLTDESKRQYMRYASSRKIQEKYLVRTYNKINDSSPDIWHIHGEIRRKSSLILSHEEYAKLVNKIIEYIQGRSDEYEKHRLDLKIKSWIDYFILADLYIVGFGFDFSEFDLWYLLNRRLREKTKTGRIFFYEPIEADNYYKVKALRDIGVKVEDFGIDVTKCENSDDKAKMYSEFYSKAIEDIYSKMIDSTSGK